MHQSGAETREKSLSEVVAEVGVLLPHLLELHGDAPCSLSMVLACPQEDFEVTQADEADGG